MKRFHEQNSFLSHRSHNLLGSHYQTSTGRCALPSSENIPPKGHDLDATWQIIEIEILSATKCLRSFLQHVLTNRSFTNHFETKLSSKQITTFNLSFLLSAYCLSKEWACRIFGNKPELVFSKTHAGWKTAKRISLQCGTWTRRRFFCHCHLCPCRNVQTKNRAYGRPKQKTTQIRKELPHPPSV